MYIIKTNSNFHLFIIFLLELLDVIQQALLMSLDQVNKEHCHNCVALIVDANGEPAIQCFRINSTKKQ